MTYNQLIRPYMAWHKDGHFVTSGQNRATIDQFLDFFNTDASDMIIVQTPMKLWNHKLRDHPEIIPNEIRNRIQSQL